MLSHDHDSQPIRRLGHVPQSAERYGVDPKTIRRWIDRELITGLRVGPRLIRVDEVEALAQPIEGDQ